MATCPRCGGAARAWVTARDREGGPAAPVLRCTASACGVGWTAGAPRAAPAAAPGAAPGGTLGAIAARLARRDLAPLLAAVPPGGLVVDIGAGAGLRSRVLARAGRRVVALEPDGAEAARASAALAGLPEARVVRGTLEDGALGGLEGAADGVLLWHVLEHLDDPGDGLRRILALLRPGGMLLAAVPNARGGEARLLGGRWQGWEPARHRWHLCPGSAGRMVVGAGFTGVRAVARGGWCPALGLAASLAPAADPQRAASPLPGVALAAALTLPAGVLAALAGAPQVVLTARRPG